ncbi:MAG: Smr/MutS family protein [Pseudomonadota bacterium]
MSKRPLSDEEAALWQRLIATVKPLDDGSATKIRTQNLPYRSEKLTRHVAPTDPDHTHIGDTPAVPSLTPTQQDFARLLDGPRGAGSSHSNGTPIIQKRGYTFQPAPKANSGNLDGHWERRLGKGLIAPDMTVDLHEHSLANAYARMDQALADAQAHGARVLLLITGKARPTIQGDVPHGRERGAIRRAMQDWLTASRHAGDIAAVRNAHPRHGGAGALYIILKRRRR